MCRHGGHKWGLSLRLCLYVHVCLSVTGLRLKYSIVYVPVWQMTLMMPRTMEVTSRLRSQRTEQVQRYGRRLTTTNDRQDNSDRRRLVRQHLTNLLCLLTCGQDTVQHNVVSTVLRPSSFRPIELSKCSA